MSGKLAQVQGQLVSTRHFRVADENWYHADFAGERGRELESHVVVVLVEPTVALLIGARKPVLADYRQHDIGLADGLAYGLLEIRAGRDVVDVEKYVSCGEGSSRCSFRRPTCPAESSRR